MLNILTLELIGLFYMYWGIILFTLIVLILNTFQKKSKNLLITKKIQTNISRIQAYDSIICGYFCIGLIDFMLKDNTLTDLTNLFSPNNSK